MPYTPAERAAILTRLDAYERDVLAPAEARQLAINHAWDRGLLPLPPSRYVLEDRTSGLFWNVRRGEGTWMTTTAWSPTWPTPERALAAAEGLGIAADRVRAVPLVEGVGGYHPR